MKDYIIDGIKIGQGMFKRDQIVNIRGNINTEVIRNAFLSDGVFIAGNQSPRGLYGDHGGYLDCITSSNYIFDASRVVQTGDRVMPRTVFENLYAIISEEH